MTQGRHYGHAHRATSSEPCSRRHVRFGLEKHRFAVWDKPPDERLEKLQAVPREK